MKSIARNIVLSFLGGIKKPANNITILNGHFISRNGNDNDKKIFSQQLTKLNKYVDFIDVEEAIYLIQSKEKVNRPLISFTFDDGFTDCYDSIAPVLSDFKTNALFFVNTGYVEGNKDYINNFNNNIIMTTGKKPMSYEQIKSLSDNGFVIGNHTVNHIRLSEFENIENEVLMAKQKIEEVTGKACKYFAWPYGQQKDITNEQIDFLLKHHELIFSGTQYQSYYYSKNKNVLNRRHFEGEWPVSHLNYFLSRPKTY